jgi:hypothetical protein
MLTHGVIKKKLIIQACFVIKQLIFMEYYRKVLSKSEANRHFIYITSWAREMFPELGEPFTLVVKEKDFHKEKEFQVIIDKQGRVWANANELKDYIPFKPHRVLIFTKKDQKKFTLACEHF